MLTRFLVAGFPRSGSSLAILSLAKHPKIEAFGELFHPTRSERLLARPPHWIDEAEDAIVFLQRSIWRDQNRPREVVGFKLFTTHTNFPGTRDLFPRLSSSFPDLRVIHCRRRNYLDAWVSLMKAHQTGIWAVWPGRDGIDAEVAPIAPEARLLEDAFHFMKQSDDLVSTFHDKEHYLGVDYDQLGLRFDEALSAIHAFLGVEPVATEPALLKQNHEAHRTFLSNYEQLAAHFRGTEFGWFFQE